MSKQRHLASGIWRLASGVWHLESGVWRLESGVWRLASSIWRLASGVWLWGFPRGINARFLVKSESSKARPTLLTTTIVNGSAYCRVSMGLGLRPTELPLRPVELPPPPPTIHRPGADPWQLMCPGTAIIRSRKTLTLMNIKEKQNNQHIKTIYKLYKHDLQVIYKPYTKQYKDYINTIEQIYNTNLTTI